ncbi:MAG: FKBP-type peptidyl-prolyl cis-trans isomerase [Chitinophagales bacterium]|jgi:FKBP-type peptidyl-prolyl cis-trans isomerase FklB|nr:FKBP-type peptidyl-prolyl cis-trans isomerase [Chitinophagaceae bacterium]MBN8673936.1 FKBP-type peptidyl-prolyl cis-trans isomerase [Chitinophagales bacterium]
MSIQNKLKEFMSGKIDKQKEEGNAFLQSNKTKEGIVELPEGLQYMVIKEGTGPQPLVTDSVKAHYKGSLLNGKEFDNSFKRGQPFSAPLRSLIKGWQIALPLMKEGSHWRLWIPSELAYGDRGAGSDIPGGATLIFEVELISIIK